MMLTVAEVAAELNCTKAFVYQLLKSGRLKHFALGKGSGGKRVSREQLAEYLQASERGGEQAAPAPRRFPVPKLKHL